MRYRRRPFHRRPRAPARGRPELVQRARRHDRGQSERSHEEARESYEGADKSGFTERATSFRYEIEASFETEKSDPLSVIREDLSKYEPRMDGATLRVMNDDMTAIFRTFPAAAGAVNVRVYGPTVEIDEDDMADWDGWVIGEPVDLD